jgi:hypothetical protein
MKKTFTLALSVLFGNAFCQSSPQTYTVSGNYTFTVPVGVTSLTVEVVGAGGAGGGNGGGGGGGGGYAKGVYTVTPGSTLAVKVGAGSGGAAGGTSSVSSFISATGGGNGTSVSNPTIGGGGAGGVGSGGTITNFTGGTGGGGYWTYFGGGGAGAAGSVSNGTNGGNTIAWTGMCQTPGGSAGTGGGTPAGNGGKGAGFTDVGCNVTDPSASGANFGGGGGGGNGNGGGAGNGAVGYCQISWSGGCPAPAAPTNATPVSNQSICATKTTTLTATGTATLNWYSSPSSTLSLATGAAYTTPTLSAGSYTYYAASTNTCTEGPRTAIVVTVNALPTITVNSGSVCSGQSFTMTAGGGLTYTYSSGSNVVTPTQTVLPSVVAVYSVSGTNAAGCVSSANSSITVYAPPVVNAASNRPVLCVGGSATLTASGAGTYTWNTGPTGSSLTVSPTVTTNYTVSGTATTTGCNNTASVTQSVSACTGIAESLSAEAILSIYPNPSNGDFTIATDREMTISLLNNLGQVVKTVSVNASNHYKANITNLANGIYTITSEDKQQMIRQKIIVSK